MLGWFLSPLVESGDAFLMADNGYPSNIVRFDRPAPGASAQGRIVNPPHLLVMPGVVATDGGFLVIGQNCDDGEIDREPYCPHGLMALFYDTAEDSWMVVNDKFSEWTGYHRVFPGPDGTAAVTWRESDGDGAQQVVLVDRAGTVEALPEPPQDVDRDRAVTVCAMDGGLVAVSSRVEDIPFEGTFASAWRYDQARWSTPVPFPEHEDGVEFGSPKCTDTGAAMGMITLDGAAVGPSVSFDGNAWTESMGPGTTNAPQIAPSSFGVMLDGTLWRHDKAGNWEDTGINHEPDIVAVTPVDTANIAVVRAPGDGTLALAIREEDSTHLNAIPFS